jgi:hypothetical protein
MAILGVTGLGFVYIIICTDYAQVTVNALSSAAFLCTRKHRIVVQGKEN